MLQTMCNVLKYRKILFGAVVFRLLCFLFQFTCVQYCFMHLHGILLIFKKKATPMEQRATIEQL